ncbi:WW domain-binding protein 4 [Aricia agestis]|uniref:WW domain-binding protein 4 n=1 Tax=Aricia agestis TaxID=91739 RepID=UPI001C2050AD|nr:WW domain-binding protein 4 [Aricia agestis]
MTTYWKSQDRKYCEFCKCWFADNKVSISFHENGKKHKENVKKHISQVTKKSAKDFKQKEKIDNDIKKMEAAAMAAYLKDVQNNADLTSQSINEMLAESGSTSKDITVSRKSNEEKAEEIIIWNELKSEDGNSYYWNTLTNETSWEVPEKYLSIAQQQEKKQLKKEEEKKKKSLKKQKDIEAMEEANAHIAREKMRELAVKKEEPAPKPAFFGPATCSNPYGSWKPVVNETAEKIDLQLPKPDKAPLPPPVVMEPERIEFKEKRVDSLGEGPVEFKKRKFNQILLVVAALLVVSPAVGKPQVLVDTYGYYSAPAYVATYGTPLAYTYPYAYAYAYPWGYY